MRALSKIIILITATCLAAAGHPSYVSLVQLIANPDKFYDTEVIVAGYLVSGDEATGLYCSKDASKYMPKDGVGVGPFRPSVKKLPSNQYVEVRGILRRGPGMIAGFDSHIADITSVQPVRRK